jgi:DNA-directed RNA polymerase alpha subunit
MPLPQGECLRFPPTPFNVDGLRVYPKVWLYDDSCGEYSVIDEEYAKKEELMDSTEIRILELSARAENLLKRHNIINLGMASKLNKQLMKKWKHCGEKTIDEILEAVKNFYKED